MTETQKKMQRKRRKKERTFRLIVFFGGVFLFIAMMIFAILGIKNHFSSPKELEYAPPPLSDTVISLVLLGYKDTVAEELYTLSPQKANALTHFEYSPFLMDILLHPLSDGEKTARYFSYIEENQNVSKYEVILSVHCNLDYPFYSNTLPCENPDSLLVLVNKYYYLPEDYEPSDLTLLSAESTFPGIPDEVYARKEAILAFEELNDTMEREIEKRITVSTAFRSYERQTTVHEKSVMNNGRSNSEAVSARPGFSEHQTGLTFDVHADGRAMEYFHESDQYLWLKDNAHRFGFIIRYQEHYTYITGYEPEEWHIRYVGIENATFLYENDICLEEYLLQYPKGL